MTPTPGKYFQGETLSMTECKGLPSYVNYNKNKKKQTENYKIADVQELSM